MVCASRSCSRSSPGARSTRCSRRIVGDYFGTRHATSNYGVLYSAKGVASILGGWAAALLYESSGTWSAVLYGSAALALLAAA